MEGVRGIFEFVERIVAKPAGYMLVVLYNP